MGAVPRIVLLEFADEAKAYFDQCRRQGMDPLVATIVSLDPTVQVWLHQHGIQCVNSLPYFTSESHGRALRKSEELFRWLESRFHIEDGLGIDGAYSNALLWYSRYFIHHMLWLAEVLAEVISRHPDAVVLAPRDHPTGRGNPMVQDGERYLGWLAEHLCADRSIPFEAIDTQPLSQGPGTPSRGGRWLRGLGFSIGAHLHRSALRRMGSRGPLLALTRGYRMEALVRQARQAAPELLWAVRGEIGASPRLVKVLEQAVQAIAGGFPGYNGRLYMGEVWPQVLERATKEEPAFVDELNDKMNGLARQVEGELGLFSHRGVPFGTQFAAKIRNGIGPALRRQHKEVRALAEMLELLQPRLLMTPFGRRSLLALGDLGRRRGIPGLLISHGSFTPTKGELEEMGWDFHSYGMLHGSYTHAALQTPLAEGYAGRLSSPVHFVRTGPLAWGWKVNREASNGLKARLLAGKAGSRVILHAGTPKFRGGTHFHVYETPDEYVDGIKDLILAVEQVPDTFLIIKFRPSRLSREGLEALLPSSDRVYISVEESFLDVLGIADLLVSFSSTTIEEALQNRVPVLLYGGGGRYQHVEALEVVPDGDLEPRAVYWVRQADHLAEALKQILDINGPAPLAEALFRQYQYELEEVTPFPELIRQLAVGSYQQSAAPEGAD